MIIHALIPARGGSKGIPRKNIKLFNGKPLISYSIEQALAISDLIDRVVVTTDSKEIAEISREYGADVPFLRPTNIAEDLSTDYQFVVHYLNWCQKEDKEVPDIIIQLRPTYPLRSKNLIKDTLEYYLKNLDYDSLRTVVPASENPFKMHLIDQNNNLSPLFGQYQGIEEPYNQPRQLLPQVYWQNAAVDIFKVETVFEKKSLTGDKILPYVMDSSETYDIDTYAEWTKCEQASKN